MHFNQEWLVSDLLAAEQIGVLGGPAKSLKTSCALDLAISLSAGVPALGRFVVPKPRPVVFVSGETGGAQLQSLAKAICDSKDLQLAELPIRWMCRALNLGGQYDRRALTAAIREIRSALVVIDPLYLSIGGSESPVSHANLYEMGPLLRDLADACLQASATPLFVHHTRKDTKSQAAAVLSLDDLAYAGISELARQWILLRHREPYKPGTSHKLTMEAGNSGGTASLWSLDVDDGHGRPDRQWQVQVSEYLKDTPPTTRRRRGR